MSNKSFSIYSAGGCTVEEKDQLIIELAKSHLACILVKEDKSIVACELFSFNEEEGKKLDELLSTISQQSKILSQQIYRIKIFINNELCLPVPIFKFNKEIAVDYLNVVFGDDASSTTLFEHLPVDPGIMNVYRLSENHFKYLPQHFKKITFHHTYSNIIRRLSGKFADLPLALLAVQFYNNFMIVVVMKEGNLHLIQTFAYETEDDVLYYLLNISNQLQLSTKSLKIKIAGMIDLDFKLYRELITYFKDVEVENFGDQMSLVNVDENQMHYFTPFFNLAI